MLSVSESKRLRMRTNVAGSSVRGGRDGTEAVGVDVALEVQTHTPRRCARTPCVAVSVAVSGTGVAGTGDTTDEMDVMESLISARMEVRTESIS